MTDYNLKFKDEKQALAVLFTASKEDTPTNVYTSVTNTNIKDALDALLDSTSVYIVYEDNVYTLRDDIWNVVTTVMVPTTKYTSNYPNLYVVGTITKNTGTPEDPIYTTLDGWHVNIRMIDEPVYETMEDGTVNQLPAVIPSEIVDYVVYPANPICVWGS